MIAPTGEGKERPRAFLRNIDRQIESVERGIIREGMASGAALLKSMSDNPKLLLMLDEVGFMLQQKKESSHVGALVAEITMLFSKGTEGAYAGKGYSDRKETIAPIDNPALTLIGSTTLETLMDALTSKDVNSGFLNRIILLSTEGMTAAKKIPGIPKTKALAERLTAIHDVGELATTGIEPEGMVEVGGKWFVPITANTKAKILLQAFDTHHDKKRDGNHGSIHVRAGQQAFTVAGILALGDCKPKALNAPVITEVHAEYAVKLIDWSISKWLLHLEEDMHNP